MRRRHESLDRKVSRTRDLMIQTVLEIADLEQRIEEKSLKLAALRWAQALPSTSKEAIEP